MTQNEETQASSFKRLEPDDLGWAEKLGEQKPLFKSLHPENWSVVWSQDSSYLAWSQGGGIVYLLPWAREEGRLLKKPANNRRSHSESEILFNQPEFFIQNLPRINTEEEINLNLSSCCEEGTEDKRLFRIDTGDLVWSLAFGSGISEDNIKLWRRFNFKHDLILATGHQNGKIKLWNVYTGQLLMELLDHKSIVRGISFPCDGSLKMVSCSNDCTLKFWDLSQDGNMYKTLRFETNGMVFGCKWSPNCKQVAAVGTNRCVYVWNAQDFRSYKKLTGHLHTVSSCDYSPDGAILATASFDTRVILWDPYTGDMLHSLGHLYPPPRMIYAGGANEHYVRGVSFSKDGQHISTVADDGYVRFWDLLDSENPECIAESQDVLCCCYSPNGHVLATGDRDGNIEFHRPKTQNTVSLQHLCRMVVRQNLPTSLVDNLHFPIRLKEYLKYKDQL